MEIAGAIAEVGKGLESGLTVLVGEVAVVLLLLASELR
jgi:hypothetical protein